MRIYIFLIVLLSAVYETALYSDCCILSYADDREDEQLEVANKEECLKQKRKYDADYYEFKKGERCKK